jgi:hypothetical protein
MIFLADQIDEIIGTVMTFLTKEHVDDLLPLARALATRRRQSAEIREGTHGAALTFPLKRFSWTVDAEGVLVRSDSDSDFPAATTKRPVHSTIGQPTTR